MGLLLLLTALLGAVSSQDLRGESDLDDDRLTLVPAGRLFPVTFADPREIRTAVARQLPDPRAVSQPR